MKKSVVWIIIIAIIVFIGVAVWVSNPDEVNLACTKEAKLCPDGSSVGRVPPSCEFEKCPGE